MPSVTTYKAFGSSIVSGSDASFPSWDLLCPYAPLPSLLSKIQYAHFIYVDPP